MLPILVCVAGWTIKWYMWKKAKDAVAWINPRNWFKTEEEKEAERPWYYC